MCERARCLRNSIGGVTHTSPPEEEEEEEKKNGWTRRTDACSLSLSLSVCVFVCVCVCAHALFHARSLSCPARARVRVRVTLSISTRRRKTKKETSLSSLLPKKKKQRKRKDFPHHQGTFFKVFLSDIFIIFFSKTILTLIFNFVIPSPCLSLSRTHARIQRSRARSEAHAQGDTFTDQKRKQTHKRWGECIFFPRKIFFFCFFCSAVAREMRQRSKRRRKRLSPLFGCLDARAREPSSLILFRQNFDARESER